MAWGGLEGKLEGRQPSRRRLAGRAGCQAGDSGSVGVELKGCGVVTHGVEHVLPMMLRA